MVDATMQFSEERGTWNIILNGCEWYYEGTYEDCCRVMDTFTFYDDEMIDEEIDEQDYEW